ncbi:putative RNA-binding protein [Trypanosoma conorhini]|uniref:Putative RNA-binding protein n=1 Tax=Trypanosoma conorhini TaxID=83891 RepID=A0A3R7KC00_9TRYP|nr:putative RNA-binding protein [Trypanosoma conorhini]RNE97534.1 putative RNA-binding protein [Trypanosoma conorhini]
MYEQDTCFRAANTPLFVQLFGPACAAPQNSAAKEAGIPLVARTRPASSARQCATAPPPVPAPPQNSDTGAAAADVLPGGDAATAETHADAAVEDAAAERGEAGAPERSKPPFRQVMRELERRFQEQMEVHRGLQASMRQLDLLRDEVSLFRTERRTAALAAALRRQSKPFVEPAVAAVTAAAPAPQSLSRLAQPPMRGGAPTADPLLEKILKSYAEERSSKASRAEEAVQPKAGNTRRTLPVDVVRAPEEPRPYVRVYYVPVAKSQVDSRGGASVSASTITTTANAVPSTVSYTEDFETSGGGVSTDLSVASGSSNNSVATSSVSVTPTSSTITSSASQSVVDVNTTAEGPSVVDEVSVGVRDSTGDDMPLWTTLREFYNACGSANRLMQALLGTDGKLSHTQLRDEGAAASETKLLTDAKDEDGRRVWLSRLRRDVGDVRKLRRFIDHVKKNMKLLDCQRKAHEAKRRLLVKAQRLARARQRMRKEKSTLSDVVDDIGDLLESEANRSDDGAVMDEVATDSAPSWGGVSDEVLEDDVVDAASASDVVEDAVVDELDGEGAWGGGRLTDGDVDVPQELVSELSWAAAESEYANALAETSDVDDMLEDAVPLPSDEEEMGGVAEELPPAPLDASSSLTDVVDDVANAPPGAVAEGAPRSSAASSHGDDVEDDAAAASLSGSATSQDADVSSLWPASTASRSSASAGVQGRSEGEYYHDATDSAESALDALEQELRETASRRVRALLSVHPPPLTPLYAAEEVNPTSTGSPPGAALLAAAVVQPAESDATVELPRHNAVPGYAADDLVAQLQWKERQLALFRQLRQKTAWEQERDKEERAATASSMSTPVEEQADYHWGMLETLLQCRFSSAENYAPAENRLADAANESSWTDAYDDTAAYTGSDVEFSAGSECSLQTV